MRCHEEVPVTLPRTWLYRCSCALPSSLALDEPSWSSAFSIALERGFHALKLSNNHCFTSIMISVSALLSLIAIYYEFHSGKSPRALSPFSPHLQGIWTPIPSGPWLRFGYAEVSLASNTSNLLLIQSVRLTTPHYLYKQSLKNSIKETSQGSLTGAGPSTALSIDGSKKLLLSRASEKEDTAR